MKICNQCGERVEDKSNFCPHCKSNSFRPVGEVITPNQDGIKYKLLYWEHNGGYVLSKSKLISVSVFVVFFLTAFSSQLVGGMILVALILAMITFLLGLGFHKILGRENKSEILLKYNDYGIITDLKHLLFYWQNKKTGAYAFSKTKSISVLLFLLIVVVSCMFNPPNVLAVVLAGVIFTAPLFVVGCGIHLLTNSNPEGEIVQKKIENKSKPQIKIKKPKILEKSSQKSEKFGQYKSQVEDLHKQFNSKDKNARKLIKQRFEPPQLTYTRFIAVVDKSEELFNREYDSAMNLIRLGDENSPKIEAEIKSKIEVLKSIIQKIDDLSNELVLAMDSSEDHDVDNLIGDMENLIKSVKDYN